MTKDCCAQSTLAALLSFVLAVFFSLTFVIAHVVTDNLAPLSNTLSHYALEEHGYIVELGFYAIGLSQLLLAFLLFSHIKTERLPLASIFLLLAGLGAIIVASFPTLPAPASLVSRLPHITGAMMQFSLFPLAALMLSRKLPVGPFKTYSQLTGIIAAVLFIVMLALFLSLSMKDFAYFGLIEKIDILVINFWLILLSFMLYKSKLNIKPSTQ